MYYENEKFKVLTYKCLKFLIFINNHECFDCLGIWDVEIWGLGFGAAKIPGIARGLGKGMRSLKDATNDIKGEIQKSADKNGIDTSISKEVTEEINKVKDGIKNLTGSVKRNI